MIIGYIVAGPYRFPITAGSISMKGGKISIKCWRRFTTEKPRYRGLAEVQGIDGIAVGRTFSNVTIKPTSPGSKVFFDFDFPVFKDPRDVL